MEKDLYRGRREDPRKGPRVPDKTGKVVTPDKMTKHALSLLNKAFNEEGEGGPVNVAANVADPQNKRLFAQPAKRKMPSFKSFAKK